jgi:hypothetical protein
MTCTEPGCEGKGERRCRQCQEPLCYACWKFFTENEAGVCTACRTPTPTPNSQPPTPVSLKERNKEKRRQNSLKALKKARDKRHFEATKRCEKNHPVQGANRSASGHCLICRNEKQRAYRAKKKAEALGRKNSD